MCRRSEYFSIAAIHIPARLEAVIDPTVFSLAGLCAEEEDRRTKSSRHMLHGTPFAEDGILTGCLSALCSLSLIVT